MLVILLLVMNLPCMGVVRWERHGVYGKRNWTLRMYVKFTPLSLYIDIYDETVEIFFLYLYPFFGS